MAQTVTRSETGADWICRFVIVKSTMPHQATITPGDVDVRWPFRAGYPRLSRPPVESLYFLNEAERGLVEALEDCERRAVPRNGAGDLAG